jgi:hypothetical protein
MQQQSLIQFHDRSCSGTRAVPSAIIGRTLCYRGLTPHALSYAGPFPRVARLNPKSTAVALRHPSARSGIAAGGKLLLHMGGWVCVVANRSQTMSNTLSCRCQWLSVSSISARYVCVNAMLPLLATFNNPALLLGLGWRLAGSPATGAKCIDEICYDGVRTKRRHLILVLVDHAHLAPVPTVEQLFMSIKRSKLYNSVLSTVDCADLLQTRALRTVLPLTFACFTFTFP